MSKPMKHLAVNGIVYDVVDETQSTRIDELDDKIDAVEENLSEDIADEVATRAAAIDEVNDRIDSIPIVVVDTSMSDSSTNAVQNKVIKEYVDNNIPSITVDSAMSDSSTNAVQNKVIKAYVDSQSPSISIDTSMSDSSTNAVQNKVIKEYVDNSIPSITVDSSMSDSSTNAVQNKVIKEYVDNSIPSITVDSAMSDSSTNAVQNKVIKAYVDSQSPSVTIDTSMSSTSTNAVQNRAIKNYVDNHTPMIGNAANIDKTSDETIVLDILTSDDWLSSLYTFFPFGAPFYFDDINGVGTIVFTYLGTVSQINENGFLSFEIIGDKKIYFGKFLTTTNTLYDFRVINVGNSNISSIGDGTITGAIGNLSSTKVNKNGDTMTGELKVVQSANMYSGITVGSTNTVEPYFGAVTMYRSGHPLQINPKTLTATRTIQFPDASGTVALTSNLPQIISLYSGVPTQSNITLPVPSGFTPVLLYILTSNSSNASTSRSLFTLPIGMYGYIPLNVSGTSEYIRLESAVSGDTYSVNFLGSGGNDTYISVVKALGYYS